MQYIICLHNTIITVHKYNSIINCSSTYGGFNVYTGNKTHYSIEYRNKTQDSGLY